MLTTSAGPIRTIDRPGEQLLGIVVAAVVEHVHAAYAQDGGLLGIVVAGELFGLDQPRVRPLTTAGLHLDKAQFATGLGCEYGIARRPAGGESRVEDGRSLFVAAAHRMDEGTTELDEGLGMEMLVVGRLSFDDGAAQAVQSGVHGASGNGRRARLDLCSGGGAPDVGRRRQRALPEVGGLADG